MGVADKVTSKTKESVGKAKKETGRVTRNRSLQAEGATQETTSEVKRAARTTRKRASAKAKETAGKVAKETGRVTKNRSLQAKGAALETKEKARGAAAKRMG
jgi:uncharacterized protein YjbJ (UPF0337 family)